ncbi:type IVB secretion system protein IcmH/DotU [Roseibium porphyridii]|uniref:Type IVB secretion system protein IcmH/DotU n=1 Tax=Roseibium porphyridii TaxID=2866279 RepID=A0ABY8F4Y1_9HYPH|nr:MULTISPECIES: type IVB secretion system protein IcmH/DotU [Stappiaceae]QFT32447.1 putative lipoprotein YiaD precursor [Labrenzia sp. THAF82]WFE87783.1 type IVB secretion system protein IcmH/DotU [Roseibium sp. KMA01]
MSDNDDPFGVSKRKGKTIVRPNPGGRWSETQQGSPPGQPGQPPQAPPGQVPPQAPPPQARPGGAPDPWQGGQGSGPDPYAPTPTGYEYGQQQAPDLRTPPPQQPQHPVPPQQPAPPPAGTPAPGAGQLEHTPDINEIRVANRNPISRAAAPLLLLLGRLHLTMTDAQFDALMRDVYNSIKTFEKDLRNAGITDDQIQSAAYALCATSDDIVQNLPSAGRHQWTQYSMLTQFFGQATGGVEFFQLLEKAKQDPGRNYGVLEVMHSCLSLGFYGKYRAIQGGQQGLERERRDLHEILRRVRPRPGDDLSPHWRGLELLQRRTGFSIPIWSVAAVAGALLLGGYVTLMLLLASGSEVIASRATALYPTGPVELAREGYQPKPPPAPEPPADATIDTVSEQLAGLEGVEIQQAGPAIMLRMRAQFDVAAATLRPEFQLLVEQVGQTLDGVDGEILVVGHTDSDPIRNNPRFPTNWHLSVERAKSVAAVMQSILQQPDRVAVEGRGADEPIAPNTSRDGKALNRRVEVFLKPPTKGLVINN